VSKSLNILPNCLLSSCQHHQLGFSHVKEIPSSLKYSGDILFDQQCFQDRFASTITLPDTRSTFCQRHKIVRLVGLSHDDKSVVVRTTVTMNTESSTLFTHFSFSEFLSAGWPIYCLVSTGPLGSESVFSELLKP